MGYPGILPPDELDVDLSDSWSKDQADRYFRWYLEHRVAAARVFLDYFGLPSCDDESGLLAAGEQFVMEIVKPGYFDSSGVITRLGKVLARDVGLQPSLMLEAAGAQWGILRGRGVPRTAVGLNLPALFGFKNGVHYTFTDTSEMQAYCAQDGDADIDHWAFRYSLGLEALLPRS